MLPSATSLAQCFIELLRETAANRGSLRTDLETILLSFLFGGLRSSPLCQVNLSEKMLGSSMTRYEYLRLNHESKRFDLLIIATRPRRTLRCSSYFSKTKSYTRPCLFFKACCDPGTPFLLFLATSFFLLLPTVPDILC